MATKVAKLQPLEDELETLRSRATLLEETEENIKALTNALEAANSKKEVAVLEAYTEAKARGVAKAVAEFQQSDDYVAAFHKRYDGGWATAMRCVCKAIPGFDGNVIKDAHAVGQDLTPFQGDPNFADEDTITDVDLRDPSTQGPPPS